MSRRAFLVRLAPLLLVALGLRLVYSLLIVKTQPLLGDGLEFHNLAYSIADHGRYAQASFLTPEQVLPTADKPPLYPLVLALFTLIGGHGWIPHQIAGALIGTGTVAVTAFLGRRVAGDAAGLVAGGLAAVYPMAVRRSRARRGRPRGGLPDADRGRRVLPQRVALRAADRLDAPERVRAMGSTCREPRDRVWRADRARGTHAERGGRAGVAARVPCSAP